MQLTVLGQVSASERERSGSMEHEFRHSAEVPIVGFTKVGSGAPDTSPRFRQGSTGDATATTEQTLGEDT